jgi:hypothetical protein
MSRRILAGGRAAARLVAGLVAVGACLAAVAYAAGPVAGGGDGRVDARRGRGPDGGFRPTGPRPPRPRISGHPHELTTSATARFVFRALRGAPDFQCRLDGGAWARCRSPLRYRGVVLGGHGFSVRAVDDGRRGAAVHFRWQRVEAKPFEIESRLPSLDPLYPGAPPQSLPLILRNPNPVPIFVTAVRVAAAVDPVGCDGATNLELTPSTASAGQPLPVPARGSVSLPSATVSAPAIALRDLPVNQDACQGAQFALRFSGEAHG